jgi:hypothetical protein
MNRMQSISWTRRTRVRVRRFSASGRSAKRTFRRGVRRL